MVLKKREQQQQQQQQQRQWQRTSLMFTFLSFIFVLQYDLTKESRQRIYCQTWL